MVQVPRLVRPAFNQRKYGYAGTLGQGGNAIIRFIQTALTSEELDAITLIENIQGSQTWDVRDLFQRDVDHERVRNRILPYLKDSNKVKFFNPLTLMLLPMSDDGSSVERDLHMPELGNADLDGLEFDKEERGGCFRFLIHPQEPAFSLVEWNSNKVKVVAVDGQHRLSALKRWKNEPAGMGALAEWVIPVVLLGIFRGSESQEPPNLLEVVRKTFVYINSTAAEVNPARRILLDDESVNSICVQELVQEAHENDCRDLPDRMPGRMPLLFFDWRGETEDLDPRHAPGSVKSLKEVHEWFREYLLGEDGGPEQQARLELEDLIPPLSTFGPENKLSHDDASRIRERFREDLLPAVQHLLEKFEPYRLYIEKVRLLEKESLVESDYAQHAFMKLRFGSHQAGPEIGDYVDAKHKEIQDELTRVKNESLDQLLALDIGMRGIVYAFSELKALGERVDQEVSRWDAYAAEFVAVLDQVYDERWFASFEHLAPAQQVLLTHIAYDAAGTVINYRVGDQAGALGALLALLVAQRFEGDDLLIGAWDRWGDALRSTAQKSLKRQVKAQLRDKFVGSQGEFNAQVRKVAAERADEWQLRLAAELDLELSDGG